jgi:hypothetical protein
MLMSRMIRNLVILDKNGRSLLSANFGECHSFGDNDAIISGFISAIYLFSRTFNSGTMKDIELGSLSFMLVSEGDLIFALSSDDGDGSANRATLRQIMNLFISRYGSVLPESDEELDTIAFHVFPQYLVKQGILKPNCGKYDECDGCENSQKSLPLQEITRQIEREHTT